MGWTNPVVLGELFGGLGMLILFAFIETKVPEPMFRLRLFRIRAFTAGNLASLLGALSRGGLQFMLIIWLQGIWLPQHGYDFARTPLWAGIYLLPLTRGLPDRRADLGHPLGPLRRSDVRDARDDHHGDLLRSLRGTAYQLPDTSGLDCSSSRSVLRWAYSRHRTERLS